MDEAEGTTPLTNSSLNPRQRGSNYGTALAPPLGIATPSASFILLIIICAALGAFVTSVVWSSDYTAAIQSKPISVYFSPRGGCQSAVIEEISHAKHRIYCGAYVISAKEIEDALIAAAKRRVSVTVCEDGRSERTKYGSLTALVAGGVLCFTDSRHPIAHIKTVIIDSDAVVCGSYNWTEQAESNHECMLVIKDKDVNKTFASDFEEHLKHSVSVTK